jgi:conjugal transfer pilus assembly protein TraW
MQWIIQLRERTGNPELTVPVYLDPTVFTKYSITQVPAVVIEQDEEMVIMAEGVSIGYLKEKLQEGRSGNLGRYGDVRHIAEKDFLEEIQDRIEDLDMEKLGQKAVERSFKQIPIVNLPNAEENRERRISSKIIVYEDVVAPNGDIIAKKGDIIDIFALSPFKMELIVFDSTNKDQVAWVQERMKEKPEIEKILLASVVDYESGWDGFYGLEKDVFQHSVYTLQQDVAERFEIEKIPTIVSGDLETSEYVIREFMVK